jgi:uncharacterized protein
LKYVILVLLIVVAYFVVQAHLRKVGRSRDAKALKDEDMVRCVQCGVHLPRSESVMSGDLFYCSPDHRQLHQNKSE